MNSQTFSYLIDEAKKWIEEEYLGQKKIDYGIINSKKEEVPQSTEVVNLQVIYPPKELINIEVITLISSEEPSEKTLVANLTGAIDTRIAKAKVIRTELLEKHDLWETFIKSFDKLRHILISEIELYKLPNLLKQFQEKPIRSVCNIPVFFLADLKNYNQDISLKKSLWTTLLSEL